MQALVAPTREDLDRAHSKGDWMDIGVASVRNLSRIRWHRTLSWGLLALSSVPIHLLYNSAVFKSIDTNEYVLVAANSAWLDRPSNVTFANWTDAYVTYGTYSTAYVYENLRYSNSYYPFDEFYAVVSNVQRLFQDTLHNTSALSNLSVSQCISTYGSEFVSGHNHVVAITNENGNSSNENVFFAGWTPLNMSLSDASISPTNWLCAANYTALDNTSEHGCEPSRFGKTEDWQINGKKIEYCLSQIQPQHCTVQFSVYILTAVICMNAIKSIVMFATVYWQRDFTLVTVGDAVSSFLQRPDEHTLGSCLVGRRNINAWRAHGAVADHSGRNKGSRWFVAASKARWITCLVLIAATIIASGLLIKMAISSITYNGGLPWSLSWGAIDSRAMLQEERLPQGGARGLIMSVLLANCPQVLVSFLYLLYNSLLTALLLAKEWSKYAIQRKALRVTTRKGAYQRSTYYLQLPLRYSVPLLGISAILHWIISQSIFLVRLVAYYDEQKDPDTPDISTIGFSLPPILTAMIIGFIMLALLIGLGFRKLGSMPVAGSCSAAISAACHRPEEDVDAAFLPVQWGAVRTRRMGSVMLVSLRKLSRL